MDHNRSISDITSPSLPSPFWADELAGRLSGPQVVNDSKSPSGTVHLGSLRGVVLHDAITRALRSAGQSTKFLYGVDDMDAMDAAAALTPDAVSRYMGVPLCRVPAPAGSGAPNYARHFVGELFLPLFAPLGVYPQFYWVSELYSDGRMDRYIRAALDRAELVRVIYRRISKSIRPAGWLPLQVICEACGKVGTTFASDWDGASVSYTCEPEAVKWARGCGHQGRVSPFGGAAKLPWNLEWAAKWALFGVTVEGCGKDLSTAGGSRERSEAIAAEVFGIIPPLNVPYEFVNVAGRKMSTSGGRGVSAQAIAALLPPELLRFLLLRTRPTTVIDFTPSGDAIPHLCDEFDRIAAAVAGRSVRGDLPSDFARLFAYSLPASDADAVGTAALWRPSFGLLADFIQTPGADLLERLAIQKGSSLTEPETAAAAERAVVVRSWLEHYAPEKERLVVSYDGVPVAASALKSAQRSYLTDLAVAASAEVPEGDQAWQTLIFRLTGECSLPAREAFAAIYAAFLGRSDGPRAGLLLANLDRDFVLIRLREAGSGEHAPTQDISARS